MTDPFTFQPQDDWLGTRADFPLARTIAYLDNAFIGPLPLPVQRVGADWLASRSNGETDVYAMLDTVDRARQEFAQMIGAQSDEIGFLYTTSEGDNIVTRALDLQPGDNIVTTDLAYPNISVLGHRLAETKGIDFRIVRHRNGKIGPDDFAAMIDERTRLVSVPWVSNINGLRHDLKPIAALAHAVGAYLYADAIQLVGTEPVDVVDQDIDFLCCGGYKWLMAGWGIAPFYVRRAVLDAIEPDRFGWQTALAEPSADYRYRHRRDAAKFEYASPAFDQYPTFLAALRYLNGIGLDRINAHSRWLIGAARQGLEDLGFDILTPAGNRGPSLTFWTGQSEGDVERIFRAEGIRIGFASGSRTSETYGRNDERSRVRISPAHYNTSEEIGRMLEVAARLRRYTYAGTAEALG
jgi:selenocysteine lyase/cysteine desulfurase